LTKEMSESPKAYFLFVGLIFLITWNSEEFRGLELFKQVVFRSCEHLKMAHVRNEPRLPTGV